MEVPNKWRGISKLTGKYIYGALQEFTFGTMINCEGVFRSVKRESIAKLAGYDKSGNEVYRSSNNGVDDR